MYEWHRQIQAVVDGIDDSIRHKDDDALTLRSLARKLGYSEFHTTRKFKELSGMALRDYLRLRRLAFALIDVRDTRRNLLSIAVDYGFSSHEAFTRAFRSAYGITPASYRKNPRPVVLRTKINTFDRYISGMGDIGMIQSTEEIRVYFASIPAHKFLHIRNYESDGYFDFWQKQESAPGGDCDTICGLLDSIKGKLDGDSSEIGSFSGQIMARIHEGGKKHPEAYGVRLPADYAGPAPENMQMLDITDSEYIVFEHGPFDYEHECEAAFTKLHEAIAAFDYAGANCMPDETPGRIAYYYHDPQKYLKRVLPIKRGN